MLSSIAMHLPPTMESRARFLCEGLPTGDVIVGEIREDVPETMVVSYFGKKSSKSGWDYRGHTTAVEQAAIRDLYFRVYDSPEPPNKEISLSFARGLISMSLGKRVNWAQFSEDRRKVREALRKKAEARREKRLREGENGDEGSPAVLGKKRLSAGCPQLGFPETLLLTPKSEEALEGGAMVKKPHNRAGRHGVAPTWLPEEVEGLTKVISSTKELLVEGTLRLDQSREELVSVEDRLRRTKLLRSDRKAMLSESNSQLVRLGEQEKELRSTLDLKALRLRELELYDDPISREELKPVADEVSRVNAEVESILFKKGLEESTIRMYVSAIAGCEDTVLEMEATKSEKAAKHMACESRVESLKLILSAMEEQLCRMRAGEGAAFFPLPLEGCPQSPIAVTHTINACPVCSLWFSCYDFQSLGCGHTYHPYCLYEHAQRNSTCAVEKCQQPFGARSLQAIGIRPAETTAVPKRPSEKPRTTSSNDISQSVTGSGCEPNSSWEKEPPIHESQESIQMPTAAKLLPKNKSCEDLPTYEVIAAEDKAPALGCTLCHMKEAAVYIKPCGHDSFCLICTQGLEYCPICRVKSTGWGKINQKGKPNPFAPVGGNPQNASTKVHLSSTPLEGEGAGMLSVDAAKEPREEPEEEPEEAGYGTSDSEEFGTKWCSDDVFLQGGSRSQEAIDAHEDSERSADHEEDRGVQGEAEMEDDEDVPKHMGTVPTKKSMKRFAAVSDLVAADPPASATKRRIDPPVSLPAKKAGPECGEAPAKKRGVGRPAGKAGSRLNLPSGASSASKDRSVGRGNHALRAAGRKRDIKEIIPAKFR
ncbi:hypothetical protein KC19_11G078700 [Ceratodon purpureus]|uniref:RING-type domain-containing protein n=1 Tax=Ceratodon purpureus TaxID=3225 RepID=A0A8T0GCP5_CERPU|nr:hypothetical protein KC19_11G078700 [Ceratodon purpureus]